MSTSILRENQPRIKQEVNAEQEPDLPQSVLEIGKIVERLDRKDSDLFSRIVDSVKTNNQIQGNILSLELTRIRTMKRNLLFTRELFYRYKIKCLK